MAYLLDGLNLSVGIVGIVIGAGFTALLFCISIFVLNYIGDSNADRKINNLESSQKGINDENFVKLRETNDRITLVETYLGVEKAKPVDPHLVKKKKT